MRIYKCLNMIKTVSLKDVDLQPIALQPHVEGKSCKVPLDILRIGNSGVVDSNGLGRSWSGTINMAKNTNSLQLRYDLSTPCTIIVLFQFVLKIVVKAM